MLNSVSAIASSGIQAASQTFENSARRVSRPPVDHETEVVTQITAARALEANVAVLKVADEMHGTILDLLA